MFVEVTQDDIRDGVVASCDDCPIVLALKRQTGEPWRMGATYGGLYVRPLAGPISAYRRLPQEAYQFVLDFDDGLSVKPFSFELPEPAEEINA